MKAGIGKPAATKRLAAFLALVGAAATLVIGLSGVIRYPAAIVISLIAAGFVGLGVGRFVTSTSVPRWTGATLAVLGMVTWVWVLATGGAFPYVIGMMATDAMATIGVLWALRPRPYRPPPRSGPLPQKPFILMNPASGGGKVQKFDLDRSAKEMGAEVVLLERGVDVVQTLTRAVEDGADLLGAAGGDGTQALVAQVAAENDLPMLCIPAGTRNHFALDLGLDRDDPSLALRAVGHDGEEIAIDLGEVGGRPFVNNVSLGAYAEIVARPEYRDAKIQTVLATLPEVTKPDFHSGLTVEAPSRDEIVDPQLVQVANNPYARPEEAAPLGTRPRLDTGHLGIEVVRYGSARELRELLACAGRNALRQARSYISWTDRTVAVRSEEGTVRAGVDGEYMTFPSPLEISIRPGALRIRVPRDRPGPKIGWPKFDSHVVGRLWSIVLGRRPS